MYLVGGGDIMVADTGLCRKCRTKYGITDYSRDCRNCEGWRGCLHWLWNEEEPEDTMERAVGCRYFALIGSHRFLTCGREV